MRASADARRTDRRPWCKCDPRSPSPWASCPTCCSGIDLLERAADFPPTAPIVVITDGQCDALRVRREHAYLTPAGARLPFTPRGPVFQLQ